MEIGHIRMIAIGGDVRIDTRLPARLGIDTHGNPRQIHRRVEAGAPASQVLRLVCDLNDQIRREGAHPGECTAPPKLVSCLEPPQHHVQAAREALA